MSLKSWPSKRKKNSKHLKCLPSVLSEFVVCRSFFPLCEFLQDEVVGVHQGEANDALLIRRCLGSNQVISSTGSNNKIYKVICFLNIWGLKG